MAFEHKDNAGSLFRNGYKTKEEHPDHQGDAKIVCPHCKTATVHKIGAWINEYADGKYFGLNFSLPKPKGTPVNPEPKPEDFDDDIPF